MRLRQLEADGIVERTVFDQVPPRVVYAVADAERDPPADVMHARRYVRGQTRIVDAEHIATVDAGGCACLRLLRCLRGGRSLFHPSVASQAIGGTATEAAITGTAPRAVTTGATSGTIAAPWTTVTGLGVDHVEDGVSDGRVVDVVPAHGVGAGDVLAEPLGAGPVGEQRTRGRGCGSAGSRRWVRRR